FSSRRRHTRSKRDWSSDVCSSDLTQIGVRRGAVVDTSGAVLAEHDGVHGFTIGQRKGLGIPGPGPDGHPRYVTGIDAGTGTVTRSEERRVGNEWGRRGGRGHGEKT